jgi:hypothetical protein
MKPEGAATWARSRLFSRLSEDDHQTIGFERFFDEVIGSALQGCDRRLDIAVARDHHHRQIGIQFLDHIQQFQPVQTAALHPDIEQRQRRPPGPDRGQGLIGVRRNPHGVALVLQQA